MAPGFFAKLLNFGKKVWKGLKEKVQQIAPVFKDYIAPALQTFGNRLAEKSKNKDAQQFGQNLTTGLGLIAPIVERLEKTD